MTTNNLRGHWLDQLATVYFDRIFQKMFTVSLIGPDGVGKTTIVTRLQEILALPVKYVYMGDNIESCNYILPTTRWWKRRTRHQSTNGKLAASPQEVQKSSGSSGNPVKATLRLIKKSVGFVNRIADMWYRYLVVKVFNHRGFVVLLDRHFVFDYYHFDIAPENGKRPLKRRLHGFLLKHTIPDPDLVICLDAPGEVIFKRKGEFSAEYLEMRRQQYKSLEPVARNFAIVNADRKLETVVGEVSRLIRDFYEKQGQHV